VVSCDFTLKIMEVAMDEITLTKIEGCVGGHCPTVFIGSDGNFYIKGNIVASSIKERTNLSTDEDVVMIPSSIIESLRKG
jgi:hypothetical protein